VAVGTERRRIRQISLLIGAANVEVIHLVSTNERMVEKIMEASPVDTTRTTDCAPVRAGKAQVRILTDIENLEGSTVVPRVSSQTIRMT
jgi:hypothetical protein